MQSVGLLWTSDQLDAETSTWQHTQHSHQTNIHATSGIWTHNLNIRAAADLRLRPRGRWDRQLRVSETGKMSRQKILVELRKKNACEVSTTTAVPILTQKWNLQSKFQQRKI